LWGIVLYHERTEDTNKEVAMISDVLHEARQAIEEYQANDTFSRCYEGLREEIGVVKELMEALQLYLDFPMSSRPESAPYAARFRAAIRQVNLSEVRAWKKDFLEWYASCPAGVKPVKQGA
jgi:hypothetical protein